MSLHCTRCEGTGFLNIHQVPEEILTKFDETGDHQVIVDWCMENDNHDVGFCDCCGDGDGWYDIAGKHNESDFGMNGPYAYNGGLPECW